MNNDESAEKKAEYATRDSILALLSDGEVSKVSTAEANVSLFDKDEYIDLEDLGKGVQRARGAMPILANVLPRRSVLDSSWHKILTHLAMFRARVYLVK